jgi:hypothetical protein
MAVENGDFDMISETNPEILQNEILRRARKFRKISSDAQMSRSITAFWYQMHGGGGHGKSV